MSIHPTKRAFCRRMLRLLERPLTIQTKGLSLQPNQLQPHTLQMKLIHSIGLSALVLASACNTPSKAPEINTQPLVDISQIPLPPKAAKKPQQFENHGDVRVDDYFWMRLSDAQKAAAQPDEQTKEVLAFLNAENAYKDAYLAKMGDTKKQIFEELKSRIKEDDQSVPYFENGYWYISKVEQGKEYPIYVRKKGTMDAPEELMFDVNQMAVGKSYYSMGGFTVSEDNTIAAYPVDDIGRRIYTIHFKNLVTGEKLKDVIPNITGNLVWAADNKTIFYSKQDPTTLRSDKIYKHVLGTDTKTDKLVFEEKDVMFTCYASKTKSRKFLEIISNSTLSNEVQILDAATPEGTFKVFRPRERDLEYSVEHAGDKFYIHTNYKAKNFRLMEVPTTGNTTDKDAWVELIPNREDVYLEGFEAFKDFLALEERKEGLTQIRIIKSGDKSEHYLNFGEPAYASYIANNPEYDTKTLRYGYQSLTTPSSTYDYDMATREKTLLKQQEVAGGKFNAENYVCERVWAKAADGVKVPISLVYRKGTKLDGSAPCLQYAYGSYGANMDPYFSTSRLSLLDRGFVYALCHIRGGQEMGRYWYEDGKLLKKKNTFTDFIACSEHLIAEKYTSKERLAAMGGSAGGLLMGAVANMRPDLYHAMVAQVPFVDVINTMLDETIPLTTGEFDEWGNPKTKEYYEYMKSYSPYDNVTAKAYPNILVTTGYHDSQVQYWEPAKWVAKLRELKTDKNLLLMHTEMEAGHGGTTGRFKSLEDVALIYAFLLERMGIKF